ncbi:hypothetical protein PIB30_047982 [Stylosanthes scabra]|uniref:Uncharacterized protein n=1 Tax=Stylosanthes scabra TaxID=79078 RepID=A0ABU6SH55_9FABA|nr:hypothetical protein [Stylosanthes scabra]
MTTNPSLPGTHHREEQILLEWHAQIGNSEKQLWGLIHSKGLLDSDAQELYRKVRSSYEKKILDSHTHPELQHAEYCLWKLHYRYIDEFCRRIKKFSYNAENDKLGIAQGGVSQMNNDNYIKAFKSFLSEASEFYQTLMVKLRKRYGVSEVALFYKKDWTSTTFDSETILKCQNLCHRFLVCMGDLERYKQQYANLEIQNKDWSVASRHYVEATRIWPDSGNPQNQLAVLATYIGDDFLAVYYCVRSLAVKEPFPDAWDNLIFLLEKNRSCNLQCVSTKVSFDLFKPSVRSDQETRLQEPNDDSSYYSKLEGENNHFKDTKLWSLIVGTISFLFITSRYLDA